MLIILLLKCNNQLERSHSTKILEFFYWSDKLENLRLSGDGNEEDRVTFYFSEGYLAYKLTTNIDIFVLLVKPCS